jgi:group I intron endonuclease
MGQIYKITNTINNKCYVGFTSGTIQKRFSRHVTNARLGGITYLCKAIRKYGIGSFTIELLQENAKIDADEGAWIAKIAPEYNMTAGGEGGDTSASPNFKKGVAAYHASKPKAEYATNGHAGKTHSSETKAAQSKARETWWSSLTQEERKSHLGTFARGENNPMFGKTPTNAKAVTINGVTYPSANKACAALNVKSIYILRKMYTIEKSNNDSN